MAEAAVETPAARFFCHQCAQEVSPVLPDYLCSRCHSGFIEELVQPPPEVESDEFNDGSNPFSLISDIIIRSIGGTPGSEGRNPETTRAGPSRRQYRIERSVGHRPQQDSDARNIRTEGFLQQFIVQSLMQNSGLMSPSGVPLFLNLHGNPGDYVWGMGNWNAVISQLINQLDGTGPPPLPPEKIEEIPTVNISQEQVDKNLQCTVCMEDFKLGEPVRLLTCQHHFHKDCIVPWLQLHGTCPICRKILTTDSGQNPFDSQENTSFALNPEPGPSGSRRESSRPTQNDSSLSSHNYSPRNHPSNPSVFDFDDEWD